MSFIATTIIGLEKATAREVKGKFYSDGRVIFKDYNDEAFLTVDIVYELLATFNFKNFSDLLDKVRKLDINISGTYKCLCKRYGDHDFTSTIVEHDVGAIIGAKGENLTYSKESAETIIFIDILNDTCSIGLLKKKDLSKREYRFKLHNQTTPQLVASCLIKHLNINLEDSLLCLDCKDGVIPIEASLQGIKNITAQDIHQNNIRNAKINAKLANKEINFTSKAIKDLTESCDYIIAQIIFSKEDRGPYNVINDILQAGNRLCKKEMAIITNHPEDIETFRPESIKLKEQIKVQHKKQELIVLIYEKS